MKIALCTLVLNEMQWLPYLYEQHKNWPGIDRWIFVESADVIYAFTNPDMVTNEGLSTDGTTEWLERLAAVDSRVTHIKHGFCSASDKAEGKCQARNRYLDVLEEVEPDFFVVVDADEFYPRTHQQRINNFIENSTRYNGFTFRHREIWYPPYLQAHTAFKFGLEVSGGFWSIPYCRIWRWFPKLVYRNHNTPDSLDGPLDQSMYTGVNSTSIYMVHMGFASTAQNRAAKNRYYENRGEAVDRQRSWYCESRACFETWQPDAILPRKATVSPYHGVIPECFHETNEDLVS